MKGNLQEVLKHWPQNTVVTSSWLKRNGVSPQLCRKYKDTGWIRSLGYGAFVKLNEEPTIFGAVFGLQKSGLEVHVGGLSAIELMGQSHFVPLGKNRPLHLFSHSEKKQIFLPKWFIQNYPEHRKFDRRLFDSKLGLKDFDCGSFSIKVSTLELALFEVLDLVPNLVTFKYASQLFEGRGTLYVELLENLFADCRSHVLKRLYLYFLKTHNLPAFNRLNISKIDLGKGPRKVGDSQYYNSEFNLILPELIEDKDIEI